MGRRRIAELAAGSRSDVDGQIGANNGEVHPARETNQNTKADVLGTRRSFESSLEYGIDPHAADSGTSKGCKSTNLYLLG